MSFLQGKSSNLSSLLVSQCLMATVGEWQTVSCQVQIRIRGTAIVWYMQNASFYVNSHWHSMLQLLSVWILNWVHEFPRCSNDSPLQYQLLVLDPIWFSCSKKFIGPPVRNIMRQPVIPILSHLSFNSILSLNSHLLSWPLGKNGLNKDQKKRKEKEGVIRVWSPGNYMYRFKSNGSGKSTGVFLLQNSLITFFIW